MIFFTLCDIILQRGLNGMKKKKKADFIGSEKQKSPISSVGMEGGKRGAFP